MRRSVKTALVATLAAVPATNAVAATHSAAHGAATKKTTTVKAKKYKGPTVDMRWGPVQAIVSIKGKKITNVQASVSPDTSRSLFIDEQAVPVLHDEVIQAQSANIDIVSGATYTSEAFIQSLQAALNKAHFKAKS